MSFTKTTHFISYLKQVCFSFSRQCPLLTEAVSHINLHFPCTISIPHVYIRRPFTTPAATYNRGKKNLGHCGKTLPRASYIGLCLLQITIFRSASLHPFTHSYHYRNVVPKNGIISAQFVQDSTLFVVRVGGL